MGITANVALQSLYHRTFSAGRGKVLAFARNEATILQDGIGSGLGYLHYKGRLVTQLNCHLRQIISIEMRWPGFSSDRKRKAVR